MRKPTEPERLYLDFDGFFASVEQVCRPALRGRPVAVIPFEGAVNSCVIAVSREAKAAGVRSVMGIREAQALCPDLILVPQSPDLYRRAHNALLSEIRAVLPIDAVKSIDELTCRLEPKDRADPRALGRAIKDRIAREVSPFIRCSIGFAANRQLAKMACKAGKPDGNLVWRPEDMPGPLGALGLADVPGIGARLMARLNRAGIWTMEELLATEPRQMRALWGNVTGERMWYALHGYDIQAVPSGQRRMIGHGRVLPPDQRQSSQAFETARLLLLKAGRRLRREKSTASRLTLWVSAAKGQLSRSTWLPAICDDQALLAGLRPLWAGVQEVVGRGLIFRLGVMLSELGAVTERQLDLLTADEGARLRWERLTATCDNLNTRYGGTVVSVGKWNPQANVGGKISFTRIPAGEDFW